MKSFAGINKFVRIIFRQYYNLSMLSYQLLVIFSCIYLLIQHIKMLQNDEKRNYVDWYLIYGVHVELTKPDPKYA